MRSRLIPSRRSAHTPTASPPAPLADSSELAACSAIPIWQLSRQPIRAQNTDRKIIT
jgi:hypothetical protein